MEEGRKEGRKNKEIGTQDKKGVGKKINKTNAGNNKGGRAG